MTETVLFDLDCTLVDSLYVWHDGLKSLLDTLKIPYDDFDILMEQFLKMKISEIYPLIHKQYHTAQDEVWMENWLNQYLIHEYTYNVKEKPGATAFLKQLKEEGVQTALVTSSPLFLVMPCIQRLGMDKYIDNVISCEEIGMNKRDPNLYRVVLEGLGASSETTTLYEDSQVSIESAQALKIKCVGVETPYPLEGNFPVIKDFTGLLKSSLSQ